MKQRPTIVNRRATHDYFIESTLQCGISLSGNEVKSIKAGMCNINEAWCSVHNGQLCITNMHITKYDAANAYDVDERRVRQLLAHKSEIRKLNQQIKEKGYTLVPLKIYWQGKYCKIDIGLAKGKHNYDKRESIKQRDLARETRNYI